MLHPAPPGPGATNPMQDHDQPDFPDGWLEQQRRFWGGWAEGAADAGVAEAEVAWAAACEGWWQAMADAVPEPLGGPLKGALEQTRLWLRLMGNGAGGAQAEPEDDPGVLFAALIDGITPAVPGERPDPAEADYLRAFQAYVDALAAIAQGGLARVKARLGEIPPGDPGAAYALYVEELEAHYRAAAAGDDFARLVGNLVNARIALLASCRKDPS